ncbi:hypothetical protein PVK06_004483 [Gossypium arboreum]|uniref:Uncharacterized protein n=1 Tax=Gossypium arboreum TaxID=29729 RepID=A0ABR0QS38_GOSAR|nr:hypothetical protein PVK06_004483 [Gossypium arboreum]
MIQSGYVGTIHVTGRGRCVAYTKEAMQDDIFQREGEREANYKRQTLGKLKDKSNENCMQEKHVEERLCHTSKSTLMMLPLETSVQNQDGWSLMARGMFHNDSAKAQFGTMEKVDTMVPKQFQNSGNYHDSMSLESEIDAANCH